MLRDAGEAPDGEGPFMASMQEAVVKMRNWADEIDEDVMGQIGMGEKNVLSDLNDTIADPNNGPFAAAPGAMGGDLAALLERTAYLD